MRVPEKKEDYEVFDADGIAVFLHNRVLARFPGRVRSLRFQIQGCGHFRINLERHVIKMEAK
jgi:hypothetical protein